VNNRVSKQTARVSSINRVFASTSPFVKGSVAEKSQ